MRQACRLRPRAPPEPGLRVPGSGTETAPEPMLSVAVLLSFCGWMISNGSPGSATLELPAASKTVTVRR